MRLRKSFSLQSGHNPDYVILGLSTFLILIGLLALASASSNIGKTHFNDSAYYLKQQIIKGFVPGLIGFLLGSFLYYRRWKKISLILFIINLILLILVFTPLGLEAKGSSRWINLGVFSFQPSELLKITYVLYVASLFSSTRIKKIKESWKTYWIFIFISFLVSILIFMQPATTMAIIIVCSGLVIYFISVNSIKEFVIQMILTIIIGILGLSILASLTPYRLNRLAPVWNPIAQKYFPSLVIKKYLEDNFHISQSLLAIGSGGITGVGFGKSASKYSLLPEPMGDSIFAVIAEEFGFIGSVIVILTFLIIFWRGIGIALHIYDDFARFTVAGFMSIISIQTIIHIGANSGLFPFTGVPLPLVSYGGTAMAVVMTMIGIIVNISRYTTHKI